MFNHFINAIANNCSLIKQTVLNILNNSSCDFDFILACKYNNLYLAKKLLYLNPNLRQTHPYLTVFQTLFFNPFFRPTQIYISDNIINMAFEQACRTGNLNVAIFLYNLTPTPIVKINSGFAYACALGKINIFKWLVSLNGNPEYDDLFVYSCSHGQLEMAKYILKINPNTNIMFNYEEAFRYACLNGHLRVVKWLLCKNSSFNISANNEFIFKEVCRYGHLNMAKYLLKIKPNIDIYNENEYAFNIACFFGYVGLAKWLVSVKQPIHISEEIFHLVSGRSLSRKQIKIAKLIKSLNIFKYKLVLNGDKTYVFKINRNNIYLLQFLLYVIINKGYKTVSMLDVIKNIKKCLRNFHC